MSKSIQSVETINPVKPKQEPAAVEKVPSLKARPILFYSLLALYFLCMIGLIVLYFTTVRKSG